MPAFAAPLKGLGLAVVLAIPALGGCAVMPAPDYRAALVKPCENASDDYPWAITDNWSDGDKYLPDAQFRADGVMLYAYDGGKFDNATWTLEGAALFIETNNHYAEYSATFDGARASGGIKSQAGNTGTWTLARSCTD